MGEARCRELCALHGPQPFNLFRNALVSGTRYSISCVGCSAALMVALVVIGMSNLVWMTILTGVLLVYKLAPAPGTQGRLLLSATLVLLGIGYTALG
jgi:predicted metal-binding membrane protein